MKSLPGGQPNDPRSCPIVGPRVHWLWPILALGQEHLSRLWKKGRHRCVTDLTKICRWCSTFSSPRSRPLTTTLLNTFWLETNLPSSKTRSSQTLKISQSASARQTHNNLHNYSAISKWIQWFFSDSEMESSLEQLLEEISFRRRKDLRSRLPSSSVASPRSGHSNFTTWSGLSKKLKTRFFPLKLDFFPMKLDFSAILY